MDEDDKRIAHVYGRGLFLFVLPFEGAPGGKLRPAPFFVQAFHHVKPENMKIPEQIPSNIRLLMDTITLDLKYIEQIHVDLSTAAPEQLITYSKEAYQHMFREWQVLEEDKEAGCTMLRIERGLHAFRREKWKSLLQIIWVEINSRGPEVKRELINQALSKN